jgi:hypothetical protein
LIDRASFAAVTAIDDETRSRLTGELRNGNRNLQHAIANGRSNFQACFFNYSDISPSLESTVCERSRLIIAHAGSVEVSSSLTFQLA